MQRYSRCTLYIQFDSHLQCKTKGTLEKSNLGLVVVVSEHNVGGGQRILEIISKTKLKEKNTHWALSGLKDLAKNAIESALFLFRCG